MKLSPNAPAMDVAKKEVLSLLDLPARTDHLPSLRIIAKRNGVQGRLLLEAIAPEVAKRLSNGLMSISEIANRLRIPKNQVQLALDRTGQLVEEPGMECPGPKTDNGQTPRQQDQKQEQAVETKRTPKDFWDSVSPTVAAQAMSTSEATNQLADPNTKALVQMNLLKQLEGQQRQM